MYMIAQVAKWNLLKLETIAGQRSSREFGPSQDFVRASVKNWKKKKKHRLGASVKIESYFQT